MKKFLATSVFAGIIASFILASCSDKASASEAQTENKKLVAVVDTNLHEGDIIFQTSTSTQSLAIQLATHSRYSHCGLVFKDNGKWMVYEAIQPVCKTPLNLWIMRGDSANGKMHYYAVKRLAKSDSIMTPQIVERMRDSANKLMGKNYDIWFGWSDENIYCSELVWKCYNRATGLEVGALKPLGEYDLSSPIVKTQLTKRYGKNIPLQEPMISPGSIFESDLLITVRE